MKSEPVKMPTYAFVSLGCPKNLVDSERMLGLLKIDGYKLVFEPDGADFVVVNTCGFIERARTESFAAIDEMLALKAQGRTRGVIVSGCLAERQKEELLIDRPEIDYLVAKKLRVWLIGWWDASMNNEAYSNPPRFGR